MDAEGDYALDDYEAESPPRVSQQVAAHANGRSHDDVPRGAESDDDGDSGDGDGGDEGGAASPPQPQEDDEDERGDELALESPAGSVGESSPARRPCKRPLARRTEKSARGAAPAVVAMGSTSAMRVASLTRKLAAATKRNAELHNQLQRLYQNDAIAFLENKAQERLRQIEALQVENRTLLHQQRALNKQIEELQDTVESMPTKRTAQREELRVCRDQLRHSKDAHKAADEKSTKLHQQVVDLTTGNKTLVDKVRHLESELSAASTTPSQPSSQRANSALSHQEAEAVIANQEDEITRLRHRVDLLKKALKLDQAKHEKQTSAAHQELEKARGDLETLHQRAFEKEKVVRSQFLELKQLKRSLKDALSHMHTNQEMFESMGGRQVRYANAHSQSAAKSIVSSGASAHEMLSKLGLLPLTSSASNASSVRLGARANATSPRIQDTSHVVRHIPCPPSGYVGEKKTPRSARSQMQSIASTTSSATCASGRKGLADRSAEMPALPFYEDVDNLIFAPLVTPSVAEPQLTDNEPSQ